jgi:hypothetical protein
MTSKPVQKSIDEYHEKVNRIYRMKISKFLRELAEKEKEKQIKKADSVTS